MTYRRNMACYGCGNPRQLLSPATPNTLASTGLPTRTSACFFPPSLQPHSEPFSSCFITTGSDNRRHMLSSSVPTIGRHQLPPAALQVPSPSRTQTPSTTNGVSATGIQLSSKPPAPSYPLLTPSGHALASGGRVKNISSDPMAPCVMYWPDNEPLPDKGQIRPFGSAVIQVRTLVFCLTCHALLASTKTSILNMLNNFFFRLLDLHFSILLSSIQETRAPQKSSQGIGSARSAII